MKFAFNEEQQALRDSAQAFLDDVCSPEAVRAAMQTDLGYDPALWKRIASELGWAAITIPEEYGGLGLSQVELVALMEPMGSVLLCSPFLATVCLAVPAISAGASAGTKQALLPRIAAGTMTATLALTEGSGRWDAAAIETTATSDGGDYRLDGVKDYVIDGHSANVLLVAARDPGSNGETGVGLFAVDADAAGVQRSWLPTMDQTRKQARIELSGVRVPASARLGEEGRAWPLIRQTLDLAAVALAAEQVGGAQRCLDASVAYAKERVQFGRPIASFQAIKHKCADMLVRVESARSAAYYAGWAAAAGEAETPVLASLAKAYCSEAYYHCAAESVQIHGGVGFTWEYDCHLHFKRARAAEQLLGTPAYHRERVARTIGL
jgi:alkylation response protein AidB-like acyl-CoA dehydrogenase